MFNLEQVFKKLVDVWRMLLKNRTDGFDFSVNRCKRLNGLGLHSLVLSKASQKIIAIKAEKWSDSAHRFLKLCADSGNAEACFTLGMVSVFVLLFLFIRLSIYAQTQLL